MDFREIETIEDATTFDEIMEMRKNFRSASRQNKIDFTSALSEANKKPMHFVLELLQNAEDANATEVMICLYNDKFVFSHNGTKKFRLRDIRGITGLGDSGKENEDNAIGHFGMGFKSVFGICTTPKIYAECDFEPRHSIAFEIEDLFVPKRIENDDRYEKGTHFILPFNSADMTIEQTYNLLLKELSSLSSDCILFLRKIRKVVWKVDGTNNNGVFYKDKTDPINDIAAYRTICSSDSIESQYLFFERSFEYDEKTFYVSIAYRVEKDNDGKKFLALEKADTKLFVFFPCEGENTCLRFKINAPFMTTSNRDSVIENEKYRSYNDRVLEELVGLYIDSLPCIKQNGYFDATFLSLLPINQQLQLQSNKFAQRFYLKTVEAFKTGEYLPTMNGGYANPSQALLLGSKDLFELINENDAADIFDGRSKWIDSTITNNGATASLHSFIRGLGVPDIDTGVFIRTVKDKFIASKSDEWLVKFYKAMTNLLAVKNYLFKKFIRLEDGTMVAPFMEKVPTAFLPSKTGIKSSKSIKEKFCNNQDALNFFEYIGVAVADIVDGMRDFVGELQNCKDEADYLLCIELIVDEYYGKDITGAQQREIADILRGECCILCEDESRVTQKRLKPVDAFFRHNGIEKVYNGIPNIWYVSKALVDKADESGQVAAFLKVLGVNSTIKLIELKSGLTDAEKKELRSEAPVSWEWESGMQIDKLDAILASITQEKSLALWKAIDGLDAKNFTASYGWGYSHSTRSVQCNAYFVRTLQKTKWLYTECGERVAPIEIYYDDVLKIYPQSKIIEDNLKFLPNRVKDLPQEVQTRIEVTAGIPINDLMRYCDEYRRIKEAEQDFNPIDISECDVPQAEEAFVNPRSGIDQDDLAAEEDRARQINADNDLVDVIDLIYGDSQTENDSDDNPGNGVINSVADEVDDNDSKNDDGDTEPKYSPHKDTSDEQKEVGDWSENWVLKRVLKSEYEKDNYTITGETEYSFLAVKEDKVITVTRQNDGKKNQRGYDISIKCGEGFVKFIEVKSSKYDTDEFRLSASQWEFAKTLQKRSNGDKYFIYFVPRAGTKQVGLSILQNPHQKWLDGNLSADPIGIKLIKDKKL